MCVCSRDCVSLRGVGDGAAAAGAGGSKVFNLDGFAARIWASAQSARPLFRTLVLSNQKGLIEKPLLMSQPPSHTKNRNKDQRCSIRTVFSLQESRSTDPHKATESGSIGLQQLALELHELRVIKVTKHWAGNGIVPVRHRTRQRPRELIYVRLWAAWKREIHTVFPPVTMQIEALPSRVNAAAASHWKAPGAEEKHPQSAATTQWFQVGLSLLVPAPAHVSLTPGARFFFKIHWRALWTCFQNGNDTLWDVNYFWGHIKSLHGSL